MNILAKYLPNFVKLTLLCLSMLSIPDLSHARDVVFGWTAIPDPLIGYKLFSQEGQTAAGAPIILGKVTTHTLTGLLPDKTYRFWLTAFNQAGESGSSEIITILPDTSVAPAPVIINISMK
jgi:hypothetical protein